MYTKYHKHTYINIDTFSQNNTYIKKNMSSDEILKLSAVMCFEYVNI